MRFLILSITLVTIAGCRLEGNASDNTGAECRDAQDCDDSTLGCVSKKEDVINVAAESSMPIAATRRRRAAMRTIARAANPSPTTIPSARDLICCASSCCASSVARGLAPRA